MLGVNHVAVEPVEAPVRPLVTGSEELSVYPL